MADPIKLSTSQEFPHLALVKSNTTWLRLHNDGTLWINPDLKPDEAAQLFLDALAGKWKDRNSHHWYCVYCGRELPDQHSFCCGEVGHTQDTDPYPEVP